MNDTLIDTTLGRQVNAPDFECLDVEQVSSDDQENALTEGNRPLALFAYLLMGGYLGFIFVQAEIVSWFRIQEMFRFQSFHMYGIIGSAVAVAALSLWIIRRLQLRTVHGEQIQLAKKEWSDGSIPAARYWIGGSFFGVGWALLGACPGPVFALVGIGLIAPATGLSVMAVALVSAMAGTWMYAAVRHKLPH